MANIVAIVGRPNVGKSTLYNRLIEKRQAITDDVSGVTRDRHYGYGEWIGYNFTVIDTGGYVSDSKDIFEAGIRTQVQTAIEEATVILFMVSCHDGLHPLDEEFANILHEVNKPIVLVANKADTYEKSLNHSEFYALGLSDKIHTIAATTGSGTGEMLDEIVTYFESQEHPNPEEGLPKIAILGRPNAGKSSFVNALLGVERSLVTDIAGTTRDAINSRYNLFGKDFILIDTAGIRKKSRVKEDLEFYSVMRAIKSIQDSDVCILMIDATRGLEAQDMSILQLAHKYNKGIVILINKWDLIPKGSKTHDQLKKEMKEQLGTLSYAPIVFTSVLEKQRIFKAIEIAGDVYQNKTEKIPTSKLNDIMLKEIEHYPPPAIKGKFVKIKYITQLPTASPTFVFFCNLPQYVKESYIRYLENKLRNHFTFDGVSIRLYFRKK